MKTNTTFHHKAKKWLSLLLAVLMLALCVPATAEQQPGKPQGEKPGDPPAGDMPGNPPQGGMPGEGGGMGGPGGGSSQPENYDAVVTMAGDGTVTEDIASTGTDENALLVTDGTVVASGIAGTASPWASPWSSWCPA